MGKWFLSGTLDDLGGIKLEISPFKDGEAFSSFNVKSLQTDRSKLPFLGGQNIYAFLPESKYVHISNNEIAVGAPKGLYDLGDGDIEIDTSKDYVYTFSVNLEGVRDLAVINNSCRVEVSDNKISITE